MLCVVVIFTQKTAYVLCISDWCSDVSSSDLAVRADWDRVASANGGIAIDEKADTGTVISGRRLEMADEVQENKLTTAKAIAEAKKLIEANTRELRSKEHRERNEWVNQCRYTRLGGDL